MWISAAARLHGTLHVWLEAFADMVAGYRPKVCLELSKEKDPFISFGVFVFEIFSV